MPRYIKFCSVEIDPVSELSPKELQTWTPKFYVLYKTPMSDGVSLEAFMITSNHELIILQLTAAKEHAVEIRGLKALLNRFKNSYNSSCIVFFCPESCRLHRLQNLIANNDNSKSNIPLIIKKYKVDTIQYVLPLKFPSLEDLNG